MRQEIVNFGQFVPLL